MKTDRYHLIDTLITVYYSFRILLGIIQKTFKAQPGCFKLRSFYLYMYIFFQQKQRHYFWHTVLYRFSNAYYAAAC